MADSPEWITEDEVAQRLGIDREKIRAERPRLGAGEVRTQGRAVAWLATAAARFAAAIGLPAAFAEKTAPDAPEKNAAAPTEDGELVTVASVPGPDGYHFAQHFLIRARRGSGEVVVVRVLDSRKYLTRLRATGQPMTFRARRSESGNWWVLVGREPRFPGMW